MRLADVADVADVQAGSLYYYFDSKDDLVEEVLTVCMHQTLADIRAALANLGTDASPVDRLRAAIRAEVIAALRTDNYTAAHLRSVQQLPADMRRNLEPHIREFGEYWAEILQNAFASGELRTDLDELTVRLLIIGAISYTVEWPRSARSSPADVAHVLEEIVCCGLLAD